MCCALSIASPLLSKPLLLFLSFNFPLIEHTLSLLRRLLASLNAPVLSQQAMAAVVSALKLHVKK